MARPGNLCMLKHGKAIGAQPGFVATWNWLVRFVDNLRGDGLYIEMDKSADEHPIIKRKDGAPGGGTGAACTYDPETHEFRQGDAVVFTAVEHPSDSVY